MIGRAALLIMDFQVRVVERFAGASAPIDRAAQAVRNARAAAIHVFYVRVAFRDGHPEISPNNRSFSALAGGFRDDDPATRIHPAVEPVPGDVVVTKRRVSAFAGSDLDVLLRAAAVDTLVLAGIATSGVVLSTLREAADRDYKLVVLSDACADRDAEVHRVLLEKVFPRQAEVLTVDAWASELEASNNRRRTT